MTEWQFVDTFKSQGGRGCYGEAWQRAACMAVSKSGLTFNSIAAKTLGLLSKVRCRIAFSADGNMIAFKLLATSDDSVGAATIQSNGAKANAGSTSLALRSINARIKQYCGNVYELFLDRESHMIVAMLDTPVGHAEQRGK